MEITYQDHNPIKAKVQKHFEKYPSASISAMFRELRKQANTFGIGDYPILASVIYAVSQMGLPVKRSAIIRAMKYSEELKGQRTLLNQLLNIQMAYVNNAKTPRNTQTRTELTLSSSLEIKRYE